MTRTRPHARAFCVHAFARTSRLVSCERARSWIFPRAFFLQSHLERKRPDINLSAFHILRFSVYEPAAWRPLGAISNVCDFKSRREGGNLSNNATPSPAQTKSIAYLRNKRYGNSEANRCVHFDNTGAYARPRIAAPRRNIDQFNELRHIRVSYSNVCSTLSQ